MPLVYVGGATATGTSSNYTVDLTALTGGIGSSAQAGDLVVVVTAFQMGSDADPGVTTAGYTELVDLYANGVRDTNMSVAIKLLTSAEASVTCRGSGGSSRGAASAVHVWRGANETNPIDVATVTAVNTSSRVIDSPEVTPLTAGAVIISAGAASAADIANLPDAPAGYGNVVRAVSDPSQAVVAAIASMAWSGSGPHDPPPWSIDTVSGDTSASATLVLRPATAAGTVTGRAATVAAASMVSGIRRAVTGRSAALSSAGAIGSIRTATRGRGAGSVSASSVGVVRSVAVIRAADTQAAATAAARAAVNRNRAAGASAASAVAAEYDQAGELRRSASVEAVSDAGADWIVARFRGSGVSATVSFMAGRVVSRDRSASVMALSSVMAAPFAGAIQQRYAYPGDRLGGSIVSDARGGRLIHTPRGGIIQR